MYKIREHGVAVKHWYGWRSGEPTGNRVRIIEPFSVWYSVTSSVPQVTVFAPQLLIIYIDEWIKDQMDFSQICC